MTPIDFKSSLLPLVAVLNGERRCCTREKILMLVNSPDLWARLVDNGSKVLAELPTPEQRFDRYIEIIKSCNAENAC